jgi:hypothetical protein
MGTGSLFRWFFGKAVNAFKTTGSLRASGALTANNRKILMMIHRLFFMTTSSFVFEVYFEMNTP